MKNGKALAAMSAVIFAVCVSGASFEASQVHQQGKLIVQVVQGDDNSPARDAFVYIHGDQGHGDPGQVSTRITPRKPGWFEISLPVAQYGGLYDLFVSEGSSLPVCKRVDIKANDTKMYTVKLEPDLEHLQN